jgi:hypothetical protein
MDLQPSGHRRRRSSLMNPLVVKSENKKNRRTSRSPVKTRKSIQEEPQSGERGPEDDLSTSEDVELEDLSEEDGLQDDEETGLTGRDKGKRKQKRRRNTLIDQRIAGDIKITAEEKKEADQNVLKKGLINALLIGLWYLFSLSISIVSSTYRSSVSMLTLESTTNGCSIPNTSISTSLSSRLVSICLYNSASHLQSSSSSLIFALDTTHSRTHIIPIRM